MDVISEEHFHILEAVREELRTCKTHQNELRYQISSIYEENKKLADELKENVQIRLLQLSESEMGQLQQELQAAVASKNAAIEMWQAALQQLEKQEEMLLGKKSIIETERSEVEKQFQQMKEEYAKGLNILSEELSNSRTEISKLKRELNESHSQLESYKTNLDSVNEEFDASKKIASELSLTNRQLEEKIISVQTSLSESNKELDSVKKELLTSATKNSELANFVSHLEQQNKKLKSEILIFEKDARESLLTAQEAVLQKKEISYKEEQYQKEIEVLKSSIDLEVQKVGMKYKAEIKEIQKNASEKLQSLKSEIQYLHKEISEKQTLFERANREKQALESKIEMLFSENSKGAPISNVTFDDMCKRLTMAERARDEYELKVSSLEMSLREIQAAKEQEIQYLLETQNSLKERNQNLLKDFNQASSDRIKLSDEITKYKRKCSELEKDFKHIKTKYVKEISELEENARQKHKTFQEQLHIMEEHYKNLCSELQKLLEAEFKISKRWRSELEDLILKSEIKITELCDDIALLKNNNTELINIIHANNIRMPNGTKYLINYYSNE